MQDTDKSALVSKAIAGINQRYAEWQPAEGKANQHLWSVLGRVYEASSAIDSDKALMEALLAEVRNIEALRSNNRWDPTKKTSAELLLSMLLGLSHNTKGTKSQWLSAVRAAALQKVTPTEAAFVKWIKDVGGIIGAGKVSKGGRGSSKPSSSKFSLKDFTKAIAQRVEPAQQVALPINPAVDLHEGYSLILVRRGFDDEGKWNKKLDVIAKISEAGLIRKAASAVLEGNISNPIPEDLELLELRLLITLNRFALKQAKFIRKPPSAKELIGFMKAIKKLQSEPIFASKYFDGEPSWSSNIDDNKNKYVMDILNKSYDDFDPGRYIGNAKRLSLVPYKELSGDKSKTISAYYEYEGKLKPLIEKSKMAKLGYVLIGNQWVQRDDSKSSDEKSV